MKLLYILSISALVTACSNVDAGKSSGDQLSDSARAAAMQDTEKYTSIQWLDSTSLTLPQIVSGGKVEVSWKFRNTGSMPLIINNVSPGCGCTEGKTPKEPIAPGETGAITVVFNSDGQGLGEKSKSVLVTANTKPETQHNLNFKLNVVEK